MLSGLAQSGGPGSAIFAAGGAIVGAVFIVLALLDLAIAIGFIKLQNWARVLAIVLIGIGVLFGVIGMFGLLAHLMLFAVGHRDSSYSPSKSGYWSICSSRTLSRRLAPLSF